MRRLGIIIIALLLSSCFEDDIKPGERVCGWGYDLTSGAVTPIICPPDFRPDQTGPGNRNPK